MIGKGREKSAVQRIEPVAVTGARFQGDASARWPVRAAVPPPFLRRPLGALAAIEGATGAALCFFGRLGSV